MTNSRTKLATAALAATLIIAPLTGLASDNNDEATRKKQLQQRQMETTPRKFENEGDDAARKQQLQQRQTETTPRKLENEGDDAARKKQLQHPIEDDRLPNKKK